MKIILDNKFNIVDVEDTLEELLVKGSNKFDKLAVFIPTALKEQYESIYPTYAVKRADGRELGNYTMTTNDSSVANHYGWAAPFNARDLAVEGALQITITFTLNNTVKKTVCNVTTNVRKALQVNDDVYVIGDGDNVISVMNSILEAVGNLRSYGFVDIGLMPTGALTDAQIEQITDFNFFVIKYRNQYFTPTIKNSLIAICYAYEFTNSSANGYYTLTAHKLDIDLTAKTFTVTSERKNTYTKEKVDALFYTKEQTYTKAETNDLLDVKADKSTTYTKTEADVLLNNKVSKERLNEYIFNVDVNDEEEIENHDDFSLLFMSITDKENKDLSQFKVRLTFGAENLDQVQNYYAYEMLELKEVSTEPNKVTYLFKNEDMKSVCYEVKIIQNGYSDETYSISYSMYDAPFPSSTEFNTLKGQVIGINTRVGAIEDKIPAQASSSNQLADKAFVNSSIATKTATFQGNLNLITDLNLSLDATHSQVETAIGNYFHQASNINENDYVYVSYPVSTTQTTTYSKVERYKVGSDSNWHYEYTLNNSGFTARQWAAINSGVTASEIADMKEDISGNADDISALQDDLSALDTRVETVEGKADSLREDVDAISVDLNDEHTRINNALYNLGTSFDYTQYQGGKLKARRWTGYLDLSILEWTLQSGTDYFYFEASFDLPATLPTTSSEICQVAHAIYKAGSLQRNGTYDNEVALALDGSKIYVRTTSTSELPTGILQYKLATSYTEDIIPNQPLLNLDQNGCNWLREEWEKGLNLWNSQDVDFTTSNSANLQIKSNNSQLTINGGSATWDGFKTYINTLIAKYGTITVKFSIVSGTKQDNRFIMYDSEHWIFFDTDYTFSSVISGGWVHGDLNASNLVVNIMVNTGSHAYPHQKHYGPIVHTTEAFEAVGGSKNLWTNGDISANTTYIQSLPQGTYTISFYLNANAPQGVVIKLGDTNIVSEAISVGYHSYTFTNSSTSNVNLSFIQYGGTTTQVMLVVGSTPLPYKAYTGNLVFEKDIEPVLLWENGNPNSAFTSTGSSNSISIPTLPNYKYIVFGYKCKVASDFSIQYLKAKNVAGTNVIIAQVDDGGQFMNRSAYINSNGTSLYFRNGGTNLTQVTNNEVIVPVEIYGSNY